MQQGATLVFEGMVRDEEGGRPIRALNYEVYDPMASRMLTELAQQTLVRHELLALTVEHSQGEVAVGRRSFRLTVHAKHRKESLAAATEFIDRMKQDVPIWKTPLYG